MTPKPLTGHQAAAHGRFTDVLMGHQPHGDLFTFAVALHRVLVTTGEPDFLVARDLLGWPTARVRSVIYNDAPKYIPPEPKHYGCQAPMIRRDGICGNTTRSTTVTLRDPDTGEWTVAHACRRHRDDLEARAEAQRRAWFANGRPQPHPTHGGVLATMFAGNWTATYESVGARTTGQLPYPALTAVHDVFDPALQTEPVRPVLTVVD